MNQLRAGQKFNRLSFIRQLTGRGSGGHCLGLWLCDCSTEIALPNSRVIHGAVKSCGCLKKESPASTKHGMKGTPEYSSWIAMLTRCTNPNAKDYPRYGGAGITVCDEWTSFSTFYRDMGPRPTGTTLDRIDGAHGYEPGNCRWATLAVQARNKKSLRVIDTPAGRMPLVDYAKTIGITRGAAHLRMKRGTLEGCSYVER